MRKLHRPVNPRFAKALSILAALLLAPACTGKNLYPSAKPDPAIMVRQWTLQTHGPFDAGDRGAEFSNPVLYENTLLFGNQSTGLVALYPGMLQVRWSLPIPGGVVSELTVHQGSVLFGGGDGYLYSVNAENGRVNWRYDVRNPVISKPTVNAGRVFVTTSDDTVFSFDAGTGKWLWHYRRRTAQSATIFGASAPLVDRGEVLAGLSDGFLVGLSVEEGQLKWERKLHTGTKFTDVDAHPVLAEGILYVPSYDGSLYALRREGAEILWRFDSGGSKQVVLDENSIFLPSTDGSIYSLERSSAKLRWKFQLDSGVPTDIIVNEKYVIAGSSYQYFYVLDKVTGKLLYRFDAGYDSGFYGSPAYDPAQGRVYALSGAGNLYAFQLRKERRRRPRGMTDGYVF